MSILKDLIGRAKKRGVKLGVKIPLTRETPMSKDREPGDFVSKAVELAIMKSLLTRALDMLSVYEATGQLAVSEEALEKWLNETRVHLGK
jgi:hypothetical protein